MIVNPSGAVDLFPVFFYAVLAFCAIITIAAAWALWRDRLR